MSTFTIFNDERNSQRTCSDCTLCCKLLPVAEIHKPANHRCQHQRSSKGCAIYPQRPLSCRIFSCRWLMASDETAKLSRPDRSHYVIDPMPDYVTLQPHNQPHNQPNNQSTHPSKPTHLSVLQIWVDPLYPDAHKDPALRDYIAKMGQEHGMAAIVRISHPHPCGTILLAPPAVTANGQWYERRIDTMREDEHSAEDELAVLKHNTSTIPVDNILGISYIAKNEAKK